MQCTVSCCQQAITSAQVKMRLLSFLVGLQVLISSIFATDNGLQKVVTWDNGSLLINGERIIIMSGEFHYQRLPVPELWLDVFQKFKANGMNAVRY
jgi:hypothetical protein